MNLQTKKLELVQLILNTNRPALLEKISRMLKQEQEADWWDEIPESVKESIEISLKEDEQNETIPHREVMREAKKKYGL